MSFRVRRLIVTALCPRPQGRAGLAVPGTFRATQHWAAPFQKAHLCSHTANSSSPGAESLPFLSKQSADVCPDRSRLVAKRCPQNPFLSVCAPASHANRLRTKDRPEARGGRAAWMSPEPVFLPRSGRHPRVPRRDLVPRSRSSPPEGPSQGCGEAGPAGGSRRLLSPAGLPLPPSLALSQQ